MTTIWKKLLLTAAASAFFLGAGAAAQPQRASKAGGGSKAPILVGQSGPLTGNNKEFGVDIRDGALAYFNKVNEEGGVHGRKVELVTLDDGNDKARSGENGRVLIEDRGVIALFGYASATLSLPAMPFVEKHKVPFIGPFTGAEEMRKFRPYVFNIRASYADELGKIIEFYASTGMKKFSVIHYDDAIGKENLAAVEAALAQRGLKAATIASLKRNQPVPPNAVADVVKAAPDVVIATTLYQTTATFIKQAKAAGSGSQFASTSFVGASALADALGPLGVGVVVAQVVPPYSQSSVPIVKEYQAAMQKQLGKPDYSFTSLESYVGAKVLVEALKRSGPNPTREGLLKALNGMQNYNAGGFVVKFSPTNHNGSQFVELTAVSRGGRFAY